MSIYQLAYISKISSSFTDRDILKIMSSSHRFNSAHNITGILMYRKGVFIQLLEGDMTEVETLFKRVQEDSRHEDVSILFTQTSDKPVFSHWVVGYREIGPTDLSKIDEILRWKNKVRGKILSSQQIFHLFEIFKKDSSK